MPMWSRCRSSFHSTIHLSPTTGRLLNPGKAGSGATLWSYRTSGEPISRTTCGSPISVAWRMAVDRSVSSYERQKDWSAVHLIARFRSHEARIRSIETDPPNERLGSNRCISNLSEYLLKPRSSRGFLPLSRRTDPDSSTMSGFVPWRKSAASARAGAAGRDFDLILCKSDFD